ncbi:MAG: MotA/TolQ/ExbB proton channel family protein [Chitinispirillales bacterium]|nr:MotA/TolQ/ExbB proton channel family protein [Chitinispirillales bacterium]
MSIPILEMTMKMGLMGKLVIVIMIILSLVSWAIILNRMFALKKIAAANSLFRGKYDRMQNFTDLEKMSHMELGAPMGQLARVTAAEHRRIIDDAQSHRGVRDWSFFLDSQFTMAKDHIESAFTGIIATFDKGIFILATISSIAPFIGLWGTVWGIMNSFYEIGNQGSASLPVVAPGIAEALITTIVGLAVAIPALFFYNYCAQKAERAADEMEEFKDVAVVRLKREIFSAFYSAAPAQNYTGAQNSTQANTYRPGN